MNIKLRNTILAVATAVAVVCIVAGSFLNIGLNFGGSFTATTGRNMNGKTSGDEGHHIYEIDGSVKNIDVDLALGELTVEKGDKNQVEIYCDVPKLMPEYELKNDTVYITSPDAKINNINSQSGIKVTITLTDDIENLDAQLSLGDLNFENISASKKVDVTLNLGDLDVKNCTTEEMKVQADLGEVKITDCDATSSDIACSMGDVKVELPSSVEDYNLDLNVSLGELKVNGENRGTSVKTSGAAKNLKIDASMGDIQVYE